MNKFNLLAFKSERDDLLNILQAFNYVHFNDLEEDEERTYLSEVRNTDQLQKIDSSINKADYVINLLENYMKDRDIKPDTSFTELSLEDVKKKGANFDFDLIYGKIKDLVGQREKALGERNELTNKIEALKPWKDIDVDIQELYDSKRVFVETGTISDQFYDSLEKAIVERNLEKSLVYKVSELDKTNYIVALSSIEEKEDLVELLREFGYSRVKINSTSKIGEEIYDLSGKLEDKEQLIKNLENEILDFKKILKGPIYLQGLCPKPKKKGRIK